MTTDEKRVELNIVSDAFDRIIDLIQSTKDSFECAKLVIQLNTTITEMNSLKISINDAVEPEKVGFETPKRTMDSQLDEIYCAVDSLMRNGCWEYLGTNLIDITHKAWRIDVDILICYATATFPAKSKLPARKQFMEKCRSLHPDEELWEGLD